MMGGSAREPEISAFGSSCSEDSECRQCWICYGSGPGLIAPCQCTGSMRWVHRRCLDRWRVDASNPRNFTHCRHCDAAFEMVLRRPVAILGAEAGDRRRRLLRAALSHFVLTALSLQAILCGLALLLRAIDQRESLVLLLGLHQVEGSPPPGEGDYWNAILHHKSTYYLAAVVVFLCCVGVVGVVGLLAHVCSRSPAAAPGGRAAQHQRAGSAGDQPLDCLCDPCPTPVYCDCTEDCRRYCCEGRACDCGDACAARALNNTCQGCRHSNNCPCPDNLNCEGGHGSCESCLGALIGLVIFMVVAFAIAGLFFILMAVVTWAQKVATHYGRVSELRLLAGEYEVRDLSEHEQAFLELEPRAPMQLDIEQPVGLHGGATHPGVQRSLAMDLQAVYGYQAA